MFKNQKSERKKVKALGKLSLGRGRASEGIFVL